MTEKSTSPILCIDVQYVETATSTTGYASGVLFSTFSSPTPMAVFSIAYPNVMPYQAGSFFKRELPPVLAVVEACPTAPQVIIIDGFVDLAPGKPGLGRHLFEHLGGVPVIGVAKNPFRDGRREKKESDDQTDAETLPAINNDTPTPASATTLESRTECLPPGAILRGSSSRPLYVTAAGIDEEAAERYIAEMHGKNRLPTMLKLVDAEARKAAKLGGGVQR